MRSEEFTPSAPGELIPVAGANAVFFLPLPLPPVLEVNWTLAIANQEAAAAVGELAGQARLISNEELVAGALVLREAVESNRIEGTQTFIEEVLLQRVAGPPSDRATADSNLEVLRYVESVHLGAEAIQDGQPVSLFLLRSLHKTLIEGTRGDTKNPGSFRTKPVAIGRHGDDFEAARFVPPPPEHVPDAMRALVEFAEGDDPFGPLIGAGLLHYQFETIHPFEDGNGRLGRLLLPLYLVRKGTMDRPLLYLSHYLERNRDQYVYLLKRVSTHGEWEPWLVFFLRGVKAQALDALERTTRILDLQAGYRERVRQRARTQAALATLDFAMEQVFVTVPAVEAYLQRDYKTAQSAIRTLAELGILQPIPESYPQRWVAQELLTEVYQR